MRRCEEGLLLLTCALGEEIFPLTRGEYEKLSRLPGDPEEEGEVTVSALTARGCPKALAEKAVRLLNREDTLYRYLAQPEVIPVTRLSENFPARLRKLRDCPAVFFCRGELSLLNTPCIALVGARNLSPEGRDFARHAGTLAAREGYTLASGGAAGADTEAQEACLRAGGRVISFVPDELSAHPLRDRVLYCSDEGWECGFTSARALRRNHYIHAQGEKTLVACCRNQKSGTWKGTSYNLTHGLSPVWVLKDGSRCMKQLEDLGAGAAEIDFPSLEGLQTPQLSIFDGI